MGSNPIFFIYIKMPTANQLIKKIRIKNTKKNKNPALEGNPQKRGTVIKAFVMTPRKPNSALRKVASLRLSNRKVVIAGIPGIGHDLQKHSCVLMQGGRRPDLPGVKYKCIRNILDLKSVLFRKQARSKYGVKKFN